MKPNYIKIFNKNNTGSYSLANIENCIFEYSKENSVEPISISVVNFCDELTAYVVFRKI